MRFFKRKNKTPENDEITESQDERDLEKLIHETDSVHIEVNQSSDDIIHASEKLEQQRPSSTKLIAQYMKDIENFEKDRVLYVKKQNKIAWRIAGGACFITVLALGAMASMLPLKTIAPYVIRVDNVTGAVDIVNPMADHQSSYDEKLNKFWVQQFIYARESYDWANVGINVERVKMLSNTTVFDQFIHFFYSEKAPINVFQDNYSIKVNILGTNFIETDNKVFAQTRYTKTVIDNNGKPVDSYPVTNWQATSTFNYDKEIIRKAEEDINPLGFQITSYTATEQ
ncbi:virB8 family protein (plasmid) [Photobacterium leiognathi subsp. mandapamensis]|uniref:virB8 family protein n=1 Tax=Photobacterium leiognathi TaxID=553611 RepID=UPI003AF3DCE4